MYEQQYVDLLNESQQRLSLVIHKCIKSISGIEISTKQKSVSDLKDEIKHYLRIIPKSNYPIWLIQLQKATNISKIGDNYDYTNLLDTIVEYSKEALSNNWIDDTIDFEAIYQKYRKESNVDLLFEELISLFEKIIENEELENEIMSKGLTKLISLIKVNKGKSKGSDTSIIDYILVFLKNYVIEFAKEIPVLKTIIISVQKTLKELNLEVNNIQKNTIVEIQANTQINIGILPKSISHSTMQEEFIGNEINFLT